MSMRRAGTYIGVGLALAFIVGVAVALARTDPGSQRLLGSATHGAHGIRVVPGRPAARRVLGLRSGSLATAEVYVRAAHPAGRLFVGLYSDASGRPGRMLGHGSVSGPRSGAWNPVSMTATAIRKGGHYWLVLLARRTAVTVGHTGTCASPAITLPGELPLRWKAARPATCPLAIFGLTRSGGGSSSSSTTTGGPGGPGGPTSSSTVPDTGTAPATGTTPLTTAGQHTRCFASPGACGYPDPAYKNVGAGDCAALPKFRPADLPSKDYYWSGTGNIISIYGNDVTIKGYDIVGWIFDVPGSNVVFDHDCITVSGAGGTQTPIFDASNGETYGSHTTIENSTIAPPGCPVRTAATAVCSGSSVLAGDIGGGNHTVIENNILIGAVENVNGLGTGSVVSGNYIVSNAYETSAHSEDIYAGRGTTNLDVEHNTLLNPFDETADIFITNEGSDDCANTGISISDNLMAGGGFIIYGCSGAADLGSSTLTFSGNDVARCAGRSTWDPSTGGHQCGRTPASAVPGAAFGAGADHHGYWPHGGYFGFSDSMFCRDPGLTWSHNTWDDDGRLIACQ
jgi:hypothetical protein